MTDDKHCIKTAMLNSDFFSGRANFLAPGREIPGGGAF